MNPLDKDHREMAADEDLFDPLDDQRWHDRQDAKIERDLDRGDHYESSARQRWLDGVDNGNRDY